MNLPELTIKEASKKLQQGEITSVELTEAVFRRIDEIEPKVEAYITLTRDLAWEQAKKSDDRRQTGKTLSEIDGIPIALKDVVLTKGIKTTAASRILKDFIPPYDATIYKKLSAAGSVLIGKVNLDEFTMGSSTENSAAQSEEGKLIATKNPWALDHVPGGSSGGSAAAVAADECLMAIGTDTGGSIRQPASFCNVTGLKVSYGLVSRYGVISYASSFDTIGPLAKTVEDAAITLKYIAGNDQNDSTTITNDLPDYLKLLNSDIAGKKIGLPKEYYGEGLDSEVKAILEGAEKVFESLGAEIIPVSLPLTHYAIAAYYILVKSEASSNLSRYDGIRYGHSILKSSERAKELIQDADQLTSCLADKLSILDVYFKSRSEGFGPEAKRSIMMGTHTLSSGYFEAYYKNAAKVRTLIREEYEKIFQEVDVLLTPVSPFPAFRLGEKIDEPLSMYLADVDTAPINVAGIPAISLPAGFTSENLPVGLQLIGPMWGEQTLLNAGYAFQMKTDFHKRKPNLH
jgi:aspartyl-tRNA(Asn)/glutamyl-tRNA(Gln) amidotransferase subunit A